MDAREPFGGPDADTLNQHVNDLRGLVQWDSERIQGPFRDVRESPPADFATPALKALVKTEPIAVAFAVVPKSSPNDLRMQGRLGESKPLKSHANPEKIENRGINGIRGRPFLFRVFRLFRGSSKTS